MTKELRDRWMEALRSGRYEQGNGALRRKCSTGDEYCCLGVLADLIDPKKWQYHEAWTLEAGGELWTWDGRELLLDESYVDQADQEELANMNDGDAEYRGASFAVIADWIEVNILP